MNIDQKTRENLQTIRTARLNHLVEQPAYQARVRNSAREALNPIFGVIEGDGFVIYPSLEEGLEMDRFIDEMAVPKKLYEVLANFVGYSES